MAALLAASPLMTIFFVVALGAILGAIPFGPLRFGAAGALFVGLAVGFFVPELGSQLAIVQQVGLALFVYTVGLTAGQTFFADLKRQWVIMLASLGALVLAAGVALGGAQLLHLPIDLISGIYSGSLTTTPALAAASAITGSSAPAVGYSLGYPAGVVVGIIIVAMIVNRAWPGKRDTPSLSGQQLKAVTAFATHDVNMRNVPGWLDQRIKMSYVRSGNSTRVLAPGETLHTDDQVVVVGLPTDVDAAVTAIGYAMPGHLADDRSIVDFGQFLASRPAIAGKTIAELNLAARFGAVITRIARGDLELLAADDAHVELGDRLWVAYPRDEARHLAEFFGNSRTRVAEIDAIGLGLGIVAGVLLGMVQFSLPGESSFALGSAAGPLVVGTILGYLQRTGPLVWQLPQEANLTVRQMGLLLFLASTGIASGPAFAQTAFTTTGALSIGLGVVVAAVAMSTMALAGKFLGMSAQRTAGTMAGILGQPALLSFAQTRTSDERIESGYATIFALGIVAKILIVSVILMF
ncbi:MAG: transporter [Arcanobacterium sp.]|nr:transporter [Arcanobacterium sp.]MDY5588558.1 TrkA C-terminal domain-containing protein [Arcanobacterium sp.]